MFRFGRKQDPPPPPPSGGALTVDQVMAVLRTVPEPELGKDIVTLGFIKNLQITDAGKVSFDLELTTPACPVKEQFRQACTERISALPWATGVKVNFSARKSPSPLTARSPGLARVANLLAVSSCKGGVGKSTVAVNLAYTLASLGAKTGLFDADVYGPSLPTMVHPDSPDVYASGELLAPLEHDGVKLMSFGFVNRGPQAGPAILRGPMVSQIINQLVTGTDWGELDYLVIDMPPGTGDIALTLTQLLPLTAAVIVTTPQELSFVDVVKGIQMFGKLKVPAVAVVENMSYFECPTCHTRHELFGRGARAKLVGQFGIENSYEIPIDPEISRLGDSGRPLVRARPDSPVTAVYRQMGEALVREVSRLKFGGDARPTLAYDLGRGALILTRPDGTETEIAPAELRRRCRCAACINELTGEAILKPESVPDDIYPTSIQPMGNYAVAVQWSDGHTSSIYPYEALTG